MPKQAGSLSHLAYRALEREIVTLKLKPGAKVTEKELIDLAGHGRTPVREAIQKLEWQGLIEVKPRVGLLVTEIHPEDHKDIMAVRHKLEPLAASLAATSADAEQREGLLVCAQAMTAATVAGDFEGFLSADKQFDEILEEACPNRFLIAALAPLQTHSRRLWFARATPTKMDRSVAFHVSVIRAIHKGDASEAQTAMEALISHLAGT